MIFLLLLVFPDKNVRKENLAFKQKAYNLNKIFKLWLELWTTRISLFRQSKVFSVCFVSISYNDAGGPMAAGQVRQQVLTYVHMCVCCWQGTCKLWSTQA